MLPPSLLLLATVYVARPAAALDLSASPTLLHPVITRVRLGNRELPRSEIHRGLVRLPYLVTCSLALAGLVLIWRLRNRFLSARQRQLERLVAERTREIEEARLILLRQTTVDELTGLHSRSTILARLEDAMVEASRCGSPLGIALLDLDHFKLINDVHGHLGGDAVLKETGRRILAGLRRTDLAGRYGGEELLLVLPGLGDEASDRLETLRRHVFSEPFPFDGRYIRVACSIGITRLVSGDDVTAVIRRADAALYRAKRGGRDKIVT